MRSSLRAATKSRLTVATGPPSLASTRLEGPTRAQAWDGTVHGLFAEPRVGAATFSSLEMGLGVALVTALMGVGFHIIGGGLLWVGWARRKTSPKPQPSSPSPRRDRRSIRVGGLFVCPFATMRDRAHLPGRSSA